MTSDRVRAAGKQRCLVVDDDPMIASLLRDILEYDEFQVFVARSVGEAELVLLDHAVDLMAVDATLPDRDGTDWLMERLERSGEPRPAAFVITGAYPDSETLHRLRDRGVEVVEKPFGVAKILGTARRVLHRGPGPAGR